MEQSEQNQNDYKEQLEQYELTKQEGIDAYAEALAHLLGDRMDPDKLILIKEGLKSFFTGPPVPPMSIFPSLSLNECPPPRSSIFREVNGLTETVWDWRCLAARSTHATRYGDGSVRMMKGQGLVIQLTGAAAKDFWEWKEDAIRQSQPVHFMGPVDAEFAEGE